LEDVLSCVDQKAKGVLKELTERIDEPHVDVQALRPSVDTPAKSLLETITDTTELLHEELQVETQTTKALIEANRRENQTQLKEIEARAER
jgi:hypothetical protein